MKTQTGNGIFCFSRNGARLEILSDDSFRDKILYYDRLFAEIGFPAFSTERGALSRLLCFMLEDLLGEDAVLRFFGGKTPGSAEVCELLVELLHAYGDWLESRLVPGFSGGGEVRCSTSF